MATSIRKASRTLWLRFAQFLTPTRRPVRAQTIRAAILGTFLAGVMVYAPAQNARLVRSAESSQDCPQPGAKVDLAFIIDRSGSLDVKAQGQTYNVEIEGVRRAILDPSLISRDGSIAVAVFTFAGGPSLHVPFTEINAAAEQSQEAQVYYQQAQDYYERAHATLKKALGEDATDVATSLTGKAVTHMDLGEYAHAEPLYEQSLEILQRALKPDDNSIADAFMNLAECYNSQGKYDAAEQPYKWALEIRKSKLSEDHPDLAISLYGMAWFYAKRGMYAAAEPPFLQALAIWKRDPQDDKSVGRSLDGLSALYREWGRYDLAEHYRDQALSTYNKVINNNTTTTVFDTDHLLAAYYFENAALLHDLQGNADAEQLYNFAIGILERAFGNDHPDTARNRSNLASFYSRHGKRDEAEKLFKDALRIQEALPHSLDLARTLCHLAQQYTDQGKFPDAEPLFKQAQAIQEKAIPGHPDFADTLDAYAELLSKTGRQAAADEMRNRAQRVRQIHSNENPVS